MFLALLFAVKFTPEVATAWLVVASITFLLDVCLYNTVSLLVSGALQVVGLVAAGSDGRTVPFVFGKGVEQSRICSAELLGN